MIPGSVELWDVGEVALVLAAVGCFVAIVAKA